MIDHQIPIDLRAHYRSLRPHHQYPSLRVPSSYLMLPPELHILYLPPHALQRAESSVESTVVGLLGVNLDIHQ
jgi:hypothetical protein